jgi:putative two-component system response regulator
MIAMGGAGLCRFRIDQNKQKSGKLFYTQGQSRVQNRYHVLPAMRKATVLIVDDEPTNLSVLNQVLASEFRVRAANSGDRALSVALSDPVPDLILLDVMMPGLDGHSVIQRLRENQRTRDIPVIFVTALGAEEDEEKGLAMGAVDYITKPIIPAVLLARVRNHLLLKQARDLISDKNAFLESEIARRMEENQIVQNVSIRALAHLAEIRDPETGNHILRTQAYVKTLANRLASNPRFNAVISKHYIELVTKSAPLHDIGKVGIPDHVLLKPGKLTPDEWTIMKTHAELGAQSIERAEADVEQPVEFLRLAKEIAHAHHEHWDGKGYPLGLKGEEIPLSARLMALADVFDALISKRVYKEATPLAETRRIIVEGKGSHFDPDVVDAFEQCYEEFVDIARRFADGDQVLV